MAIVGRIVVLLVSVLVGAFGTAAGSPSAHNAGRPNQVTIKPPSGLSKAQRVAFLAGETVTGQSGCETCHLIGNSGNNGPGPPLTHTGTHMKPAAISYSLRHPTAPMPSFADLAQSSPKKFNDLVTFLSLLK